MRVALVSRELFPYVGGGIAPIVAAAARLLSESAEVTVLTSDAHRTEHERLAAAGDARLLPASVALRWVPTPASGDHGDFLGDEHAYSAAVHDALGAAYGDDGPDLIEFCDYRAEGFVTLQAAHTRAAWLANTRCCVRLHTTAELVSVLDGHLADDFATRAIFEAERYCLRRADALLVPGGDVLDTYRRFYGAEALAPAVEIPDAFFDPATAAYHGRGGGPRPGEPVRLIYCGRLERRKGVHALVQALLDGGRGDWRLTLLGADTDTGPLGTSIAGQLQLAANGDPRITFAGPVAPEEVGAFLRDHDIVVLPSLWECWPNAARQALALNRPVLATPVGGLSAMVQPGRSGWLTAGTSPAALEEGLAAVLDAPDAITRLIASGGPRAVFEQLTDPAALVSGYRALAQGPPRRAAAARRAAPPVVSVIVPYFHLPSVVEETLDSVAAQTHPAVETIVVVDGSFGADDQQVLDRIAQRPRVTVVSQVNSGLGAARNLGIAMARGDYVLPLDADDVLEPAFVERCLVALEADPELAYVSTWVRHIDPGGAVQGGPRDGYMGYGNWSALMETNNVGGVCACVFRRSVLEALPYSAELTSYEDWALLLALHHAGVHGAIVPEPLFRYRRRATSMMRTVGTPMLGRLHGEVRAHAREAQARWTATAEPAPRSAPDPALLVANERLRRDSGSRQNAAAAALQGRLKHAEERIADLEGRLAAEVQIALQNDANYQAARRELDELRGRRAVALVLWLSALRGGR